MPRALSGFAGNIAAIMITMRTGFGAVFKRDITRRFRNIAEALTPLFFFAATIAVFAIALGGGAGILAKTAPGVLWSAALFAALLAQEGIFAADNNEGFSEQMLTSPHSLTIMVFAKSIAHWLFTGAPLCVAAGFGAVALHLPVDDALTLAAALFVGTPVFSLLAAFVSALCARNAVLAVFLALPLALPALIFGAAASGGGAGAFLFLAASLTFALTVLPLATAAALRATAGY